MEIFMNTIGENLDNYRSLDQNMNDLKRKLEFLNALKEDTELKLMTELQPRKKPKKQVHVWLEHVERINGEVQDIDHRIAESRTLLRGLYTKYVLKKIQEVEDLILQRGQFDQGLVMDDHKWIGQVLSTTKLVGNAAEICMREIWTCLMNDDVGKIGVLGMGGLGKTTIMKIIHNQLLKETQKFDIVIWVTVSKEMDIFKIQDSISIVLKVNLPKDEPLRAGKLFEKLTKKGRYVLILDDLWDQLSLEEVGIPEPSRGSKLVVTTRKLDVCRYLGCREVEMPTLPPQDAWSLFSEKVGRDVLEYENLLPIVKSVADQCAGLPLAIVTVASNMKGKKNVNEWRNALNELSRSVRGIIGLDDRVLQQLQFSYDHLENEIVQHCFLCCALFPEDSNISEFELIKLWITEGLVEELDSHQEEVDQGYAILNKLKSNCLLEKAENSRCVKLHDLVRDMALRITRVRPRFLVRVGMQLKEIPHAREWTEDLEKVSLMMNFHLKIPSQISPPKCQRLTTLLLSECYIVNIPDCFFEHMKGLKVLDLSRNDIKELPSSILNLEALTELVLTECHYLENMPSFSKLQALKKLSLGGRRIKNLPLGMESLVNLNHLYVDMHVKEVSSGILSKYPCMRSLVIKNLFAKGEEIGELEKLQVFEGRFYDSNELNAFVQALHGRTERLSHYRISVDDKSPYTPGNPALFGLTLTQRHTEYSPERYIELRGCKISRNGVKFPFDVQELSIVGITVNLPEEVALFSWFVPAPNGMFPFLKGIHIRDCKTTKKLFSCSWVLRNLQNLEVLSIWNFEELEEIIVSETEFVVEDGMGSSNSNTIQLTLPKLRKLVLWALPKLKSICGANRVMVCDSLEEIWIKACPKLQRIPLYLPLLDDGQPSPPFKKIVISKERWNSVELDHPNAKSLLRQFLFFESD